ncbi:MAG TPA: APC family permease [Candidatus Limnocylindria bacterium]|jgi:amino acid transporter|nr:APC family permease [Candidatus Limnocylindria bacterium]
MSDAPRLRAHCLNFWEVLAQAIALISPTMTAALIVPLMYGTTGNASWLAYAFGTIMLLFVAFNLNQFARRSSHTGSMFLYSVAGLGPTTGGLAGWCLIWAYVFIGTAGMTGFTVFAQQLLGMVGVHVPALALFAVCALVSWYLAYRDIQLSTLLMLAIESVSMALITALALITLGHHGFAVDTSQLTLSGGSISSLGLGVVVAIFSLVGFECATAFGEEAKTPLKTIPRAVIASLLISGLFFVFISYTEILGLRNANPSLDKLTTPLSTLATVLHLDVLQIPIDVGAMISFFSLALSCMNAGARIVYQMGRQGFFHASAGRAHVTHATPHVAVTAMALIEFAVPAGMTLGGIAVSDAFNDAGTFGAFGFLGAYVFVAIAAPMYLRKIGELRRRDVAYSVVALAFLLVPAVGSVYPVPAPPVNLFPYIFLAYFLVGLVVFVVRRGATKSAASRPLTYGEPTPALEESAVA